MNAFLALVAVLGVSASGPLMAGAAAPALAIGMWRNALGAVATAPFAARRAPAELRSLDRGGRRDLVLAGVMLAVHFGTWITALKFTTVAAATAMVSMQLVFIVLIDRLHGSRIPGSVIVGAALALGGVFVITGVDFSVSNRALTGDLLGLVGGLAAAIYLDAGSRVRRQMSASAYSATCYGICAVLLAVVSLIAGIELTGFALSTWIAIIAVTITAQLLGHSVFNHLLSVMSPSTISLLLLLEVPGAALLAGVFLGQTPAAGVYAGLVLILAGLGVVVLRRPVAEVPPA